jgi:hypothetical protein
MTTDNSKGANGEVANTQQPNDIAQNIARAIASSHAMFYGNEGEIALLTAPAKVLVTLILQPGITRRAISVYLGVTEAAIQKSMNTLIKYGLIAKTKVGTRNVYEINEKLFINSSDISHILSAIAAVKSKEENNEPF